MLELVVDLVPLWRQANTRIKSEGDLPVTDETNSPPPEPSQPPGNAGAYSQHVQHSSVGARLPDRVAQGTFCTGVIVMEGPQEFVLDFVQTLSRPPRVAARVILSPTVMSLFVAALNENLEKYDQAFGQPKALPPPSTEHRPGIQEIYQDLKLPDDLLSGVYANTVMIGHSPAEFCLDFITRFFPTAAVSSRVYLSASQVPQVLAGLKASLQNRRNRDAGQQGKPPAGPS